MFLFTSCTEHRYGRAIMTQVFRGNEVSHHEATADKEERLSLINV